MPRPQEHFVKHPRIKDQGGQALVMFALALTTICGFLALAVDVGLAYSIRKSAQSAADLAALAGVQQALSVIGTAVYSVGSCPATAGCTPQKGAEIGCSSSPANPPQNSIDSACLYALRNGFVNGSPNNGYMQTVSVAAFTNPSTPKSSPIYAPGLYVTNYWVYVEITEQVPYLFGGVLSLLPGVTISLLSVDVSAVAAIVQTGSGASKKSTISLVQ
jgi:uncharacterized membrane protein